LSTITVIAILSPDPAETPRSMTIDVDKPQELEQMALRLAPLVLVTRIMDLDFFRRMSDVVTDVGVKAPKIELSRYFLDDRFGKAPLLEAAFTSSGKAKSSICTMLKNAVKRGVTNLFMIGVPQAVFADLASDAQPYSTDTASHAAPNTAASPSSRSPLDLMQELPGEDALQSRFLGRSNQHIMVRRLIMYAAKNREPVLVLGETGTGKGLVAQLIHEMSPDGDKGLVMAVNCAGLPEKLLESELFGHVKGAFTGAVADKIGMWEAVGKKVLFLDEIADMPLGQQAKVLQALHDKIIRRVGENQPRKVNPRIVAATNRDLYSMMRAGEFRKDLYYRLRGFIIRTPPLRKNPDNIPLLAEQLWQKITDNKRGPLSEEVLRRLQGMGWPGNVRELKLFLASLHSYFPPGVITEDHVSVLLKMQGMGEYEPRERVAEAKVEDIALHRAQCLGHLKQAEDVLLALRMTLEGIVEGEFSGSGLRSMKDELSRKSAELAALCEPQKRLFFYDRHARDVVCALSEKSFVFSQGLDREPYTALLAWASKNISEFEKAESVVFDEIAKVVKYI